MPGELLIDLVGVSLIIMIEAGSYRLVLCTSPFQEHIHVYMRMKLAFSFLVSLYFFHHQHIMIMVLLLLNEELMNQLILQLDWWKN